MEITWTVKYIAEFLGTAILVILANGVISNVVLKEASDRKPNKLLIGLGYGFGVMVPALMFASVSGAHLNPAYTVALAAGGYFSWNQVAYYVAAQLLGAVVGQLIIVVTQRNKYANAGDSELLLSTFASVSDEETREQAWIQGGLNEFFASFIFFFGAMMLTKHYFGSTLVDQAMLQATQAGVASSTIEAQAQMQTGGTLSVAYMVLGLLTTGLVMSFGGLVGPALNPARDLGSRIVYAFVPGSVTGEEQKDGQWWYASIPLVVPFVAGACAVFLFKVLFG